jgi:hypothetical protein
MNRNILYALIFFLVIEKTNGQSVKFANTFRGQTTQYGIVGTNIVKFDPTGNSSWVKNFSGYIIPSAFQNRLIGSAFDGNYLYVLELQGEITSGPPPIYYPALIKMDTLGNILFIKNSSVMPGGSYNMYDVFPSLTGGIWVLDDYSPGFTHCGNAQYFDSTGQTGVCLGLRYGSVTTPREFLILPDSNYVIAANERPSAPGQGYSFPTLTKFERNGSIIWRADFTPTGASLYDWFGESSMTADSSGNIYLICFAYVNTTEKIVGLKVSSTGNVLISKSWPSLSPTAIQGFEFRNGELHLIYNGTEITFDTLFNNTCLNSQVFPVTTGNNYFGGSYPQSYSSSSFTPVNGNSLSYQQQLFPDYCATASSFEMNKNETYLNIFPNPTERYFYLQTNLEEYFQLKISDLLGNLIMETYSKTTEEIDVSMLPPGIYFVTIKKDEKSINKRFIVQ